MLVPFVASHFTGGLTPSPTPDADGPRNCGQSPANAAPAPAAGIAGNRRGDEDPVTPHDGRRVGEPGDFDAPDDVGTFCGVPFHRGFDAVPYAGRRWTAELRPIARECRARAGGSKRYP